MAVTATGERQSLNLPEAPRAMAVTATGEKQMLNLSEEPCATDENLSLRLDNELPQILAITSQTDVSMNLPSMEGPSRSRSVKRRKVSAALECQA